MNLKELFNFSYLKQNLKKSKVTLAFVLLILPILNLVVFLMSASGNNINVFSLNEISTLTILGMYILPVVLSILLFSFVFKKKSVDFMGSMPIDRKQIFFTNTLGGIIIIILLVFITAFLMMITSAILPNIYVPAGVFIDYLSMFIISYIFVFSACNIGVSVSGNTPTVLVVTALILFFVPYHHFMYDKVLTNENSVYYQLGCKANECNVSESTQEKDDMYYIYLDKKTERVSYTMPFEVISIAVRNDEGIEYNTSTIGKMALLSLVYILVGYLLFEKREMEVCETSFKSFKVHQLVKILTLIPILVVVSLVLKDANLIGLIFAVCLLVIYNFVYDLITRHSIIKIKDNLIAFSLVFIGVVSLCFLIISNNSDFTDKKFNLSDIDDIQIKLDSFNFYSNGEVVSIKDEALKNKIIDGLFFNNMVNYEEKDNMNEIMVELMINGDRYKSTAMVDKEVYSNIANYIRGTNICKSNTLKALVNKKEIITLGNDYVTLDKNGVEILKKSDNDVESSSDFYIPISIYIYQNHKLKEYIVNSNINSNLNEYAVALYNERTKDVDFSKVYSFSVVNDFNPEEYYYLDGTVSTKTKIKKIMNQKLDFSKDIYKITFYRNDSPIYYYANLDEKIFDTIKSQSIHKDDVYYDY